MCYNCEHTFDKFPKTWKLEYIYKEILQSYYTYVCSRHQSRLLASTLTTLLHYIFYHYSITIFSTTDERGRVVGSKTWRLKLKMIVLSRIKKATYAVFE